MLPVLSSYEVVLDPDKLKALADAGFKAVNMCICYSLQPGETQKYADHVRQLADLHRSVGLKFFMRWPPVDRLGIITEDNGFRCTQGLDPTSGPSHWCKEATEKEIETLEHLSEGDVDGILVSPLISDVPFPAWEPQEGPRVDLFWCYDRHAKASYAEHFDDFPMPAKPGDPTPDGFYKWYQGAVLRKYHELSEAALTITKQLLLWFTPSVNCVSAAQPGLEVGVECWRQKVMAAGGKQPIFVTMSLFPRIPWGEHIFNKVKELTDPQGIYGWRCIGGIMHANTPDIALLNLTYNAPKLAKLGMVGLSTGAPAVAPIPEQVKGKLEWLSEQFREDFEE